MTSVSLILPLLTARDDVRDIAVAWSKTLGGEAKSFEILLIDDANAVPPDAAWLKETPGLRLIKHPAVLGIGAALQTGIDLAAREWILAVLADRQFAPHDAKKLFTTKDADIVAAYRIRPVPAWLRTLDLCKRALSRVFLGDAPEPRDTWLGTTGLGRRFMARRLFGVGVDDPECGLLLARRSMFQRFRIQSRGTFAWIEILAKANHLGMMIAEVPMSWRLEPRPSVHVARDAHRVFHHPDFSAPPKESKQVAHM